MGKSLSLDIRERVVLLVEDGLSCREAARRLRISAASAVRIVQRKKRTGGIGDRSVRQKITYPKLANLGTLTRIKACRLEIKYSYHGLPHLFGRMINSWQRVEKVRFSTTKKRPFVDTSANSGVRITELRSKRTEYLKRDKTYSWLRYINKIGRRPRYFGVAQIHLKIIPRQHTH